MTTREKKHEKLLIVLLEAKNQKKKSHSIMNVIRQMFMF